MIDSLPSLLLVMFTMGFMGSLHCIGMCGGLITAVSMSSERICWLGLFIYQLGRITTYAMLGCLLGILGMGLSDIGGDVLQRILAVSAGLLMIVFALNLAGWLPDPLRRLSTWVTRKIGLMQQIAKLAAHARLRGWYALGLVNGLLPCGLVYAALAMALAQGGAFYASMMMASFGLGTIPAMMFVPSILQKMSPIRRLKMMRIAALLMICLAILTIYRGISMLPMHHVMS
ncbi:MAG: sulfite exporter TauE/SafE family protein [Mariprofundaceae bacterium]